MMAMVDSFLAAYSRANGSSPLAWSKGRWPTAVLHSSREPGVVSLKKQYGNQTVEAPVLGNGVAEGVQGSYRSSIVKFPDFSSHGMTISLTLRYRNNNPILHKC